MKRSVKNHLMKMAITAIVIAVILAIPFSAFYYAHGTIEVHSPQVVTSKERVCESKSDCYWMVFTTDAEFAVKDSILHLRFNSTSIYRAIEVGETYRFRTYGYRIPLFSMYPNILTVTKVTDYD